MKEIKYTIPGDPMIRTAPASMVGTRGWKVQGCVLVPEPKPRQVEPLPEVQAEAPEQVTKRGPGRPKANADADQA